MPGQLDQKNKRFQLNSIGKGISYDRVANDFLWLKDAGVAIPVYNISEPKLPLIISENRNLFKLFFSDIGLLTSLYSTAVKIAVLNKDSSINNGALFENVERNQKRIYMPIYMIMFLEDTPLQNTIYKLDLSGLN